MQPDVQPDVRREDTVWSIMDTASSPQDPPDDPPPPYSFDYAGAAGPVDDGQYPIVYGLAETTAVIAAARRAAIAYVSGARSGYTFDTISTAMVLYIEAISHTPVEGSEAAVVQRAMATSIATTVNTVAVASFERLEDSYSITTLAYYAGYAEAEKAIPSSCIPHIATRLPTVQVYAAYVVALAAREKRLAVASACNTAFDRLGRSIVNAPPCYRDQVVEEYLAYIKNGTA